MSESTATHAYSLPGKGAKNTARRWMGFSVKDVWDTESTYRRTDRRPKPKDVKSPIYKEKAEGGNSSMLVWVIILSINHKNYKTKSKIN